MPSFFDFRQNIVKDMVLILSLFIWEKFPVYRKIWIIYCDMMRLILRLVFNEFSPPPFAKIAVHYVSDSYLFTIFIEA